MTLFACFRNRPQHVALGLLVCSSVVALCCSVATAQSIAGTAAHNARRNPFPGSTNYFPFNDIETVIQKWSANQHLYVQGNLGLSQSQLMGLASWLHQSGPHWTVILMEDASNQRYTNREGRIEIGMDAVELSISALMEVGSFKSQTNLATGERDAAVFVLFLKQRKFSYRASEAQNRRALGQNRWIGKLDRPAYRAMRGGGRVLDAVRDTVTSINQSLARTILQEQKVQQQKRIQRQHDIDEILSRLNEVENKLSQIETSASIITQDHPNSLADLANPEVADIRGQIAKIRNRLTQADVKLSTVKESTDSVDNQSDDWINLYREYERFATSEKQLREQKQQLEKDSQDFKPELESSFLEIEQMLSDASSGYKAADSEFQIHLNSAAGALQATTNQLQSLRIKRAQKEARKTLIQRVCAGIGSVFTAIFAGLFLWLNRKRSPAKIRANEKLLQREKEVRQELYGIEDLLKRADVVIGDRAAITRKGYQGKTKDLANKALDDIDQILIMSSSVDKVIDQAKQKITPTSFWAKINNWWSADNFNEGFELLENKPIEFDENEGVSLVHEHDAGDEFSSDSNVDSKGDFNIANRSVPRKMSLSFTELFEIFRQRSVSANDTIEQVEQGWTKIVSTNQELQSAIDSASAHEQTSRDASETDGLLYVPQLFDDLLKSAQEDQDQAEIIGKHDPISAIEGPATRGLRKAANADQLARQLITVRENLIPSIRSHAELLVQRDRDVEWVDAALNDITDRAQRVATEALLTDVSNAIDQWRHSFEEFDSAVSAAVRLHDRSVDEIQPQIGSVRSEVNAAKNMIADRIGLPPESALAELNRDAFKQLQTAQQHNAAALASLDRGDPPAAALALAEADHWIAEAKSVKTQSLEVLDSLLMAVESLENRIALADQRINDTVVVLKNLQDRFAKSSLTVEGAKWEVEMSESIDTPTDAMRPMMSASDLFLLAKRQSQKSRDAAINSAKQYHEGQLLAAEESFRLGQRQIACCEYNQKLIEDCAVMLEQMVKDNVGKLELLCQRFTGVKQQIEQHHVTSQTHALHRAEVENLSDLQLAIESESVRRDPFNEASAIDSVGEGFEKLIQQINVDKSIFEAARDSLRSLEQAIEQSESTIVRARHDQIPDSRNVQQSIQSLKQSANSAADLRTRLKTPHQDWRDIDEKADQLLSAVTTSVAELQSELDTAKKAAHAIQLASSEYQQALHWSGGFGVRANPGSARAMLDQARSLLSRGDYQSAVEHARQAKRHILNSIAAAQTEVMRHQAAQRRAAEQRRREDRQRVSTNRSILVGGGARSSRSWPRQSSSSSRRSDSSGRGGFSRSGW